MWYKPTDRLAIDWRETYVIDEDGFMCKCERVLDMAHHRPTGRMFTPKWIWV